MRATAAKRSLLMCLAIPLVAGMAVAAGAPVFICRLDPVPRFACCCQKGEHEAAHASVAATPSDRMVGCCDVAKLGQPIALPITLAPAGGAPLPPPACLPGIVPSADLLVASGRAGPEPAAPPLPIPLLLQKRSLLL
jgi:hypothetical protein